VGSGPGPPEHPDRGDDQQAGEELSQKRGLEGQRGLGAEEASEDCGDSQRHDGTPVHEPGPGVHEGGHHHCGDDHGERGALGLVLSEGEQRYERGHVHDAAADAEGSGEDSGGKAHGHQRDGGHPTAIRMAATTVRATNARASHTAGIRVTRLAPV